MKNKLFAVVLVVIVAIAIAGLYLPVGKSVVSQVVGAVSGPDTYFPYVANNDVQRYSERKGYNAATTTICAFKSPSATSTLRFASAQFTTATSVASTVTIAKATTAFATTTALAIANIGAGAQATIVATSTADTWVIAPSNFVVVGMQGGVGTFSPVGTCEVEFVRN